MSELIIESSPEWGKTYLYKWFNHETAGIKTVVEFGAGFFDNLAHLNASVTKKIGLEIWQPYIDNAKFHECEKLQADFTKFEDYVNEADMDCALFVDTLEHITKEAAFELMPRVMEKFNKVMLMIPEGHYPLEEDVTGFGAHEYQTHKSTWYAEDIEKLGFDRIVRHPTFHPKVEGQDTSCIFATWNKK
jgi:hypothetical protein